MVEHGIYFGKPDLYQAIKEVGGVWNDTKERPIVCLLKSADYEGIYWAIPIGNYDHRNADGKKRIQRYMDCDVSDLRSCYYHVGNTDVKSIFFISDVIPVTDEYVEREYKGKYTNQLYVIKNSTLISELQRKLARILAFEKQKPNYFRQHITDMVSYLTKLQKS